jgi:hypothetical protein
MTRREGAIVAFAVATLVLAVVIAFGHTSSRPTSDGHLPVLNGPSPAASPASPTGPSTLPAPTTGSTPRRQPSGANVAMGRFGPGEDEAEDEPASAEAASSRSMGSASASASGGGSGGQRLLPGVPLPVPSPLPVPLPRSSG